MKNSMEEQAVKALKATLRQLSAVTVRDISVESQGPGHRKEIVAHIDVYGRPHTLFCKVKSNGQPRNVRTVLGELHKQAARFNEKVTPVFIAPLLSTEAQSLCRQRQLGFVDLEGNAHLVLNDVFFGKRCLPRQTSLTH
jgi:hypothetical protein